MSNIIPFKPRAPKPTYTVDDPYFFISCLHTAANVAAYVYNDHQAVELLISEMRSMYLSGSATAELSEETRQVCARYLSHGEHRREDVRRSIDFIYSVD
jgi:hypothetical protein